MKMTFQLTATLTLIATVAGISIAAIYTQTESIISKQKGEQLNSALESLFPDGAEIVKDSIVHSDNSTLPFWLAKKSENGKEVTLGFAFEGGGQGYSSIVRYLAAVSNEGKILGLTILSQEETPGLGTRVLEEVSNRNFWNGLFAAKEKTEPWFIAQFRNLDITKSIGINKQGEWHLLTKEKKAELISKNEVTAITGATITTAAVTNDLLDASNTVTEIKEYLSSKSGGSK